MKFFIENVTYIANEQPILAITWSCGTTDYYPWLNYPYQPDFNQFKPWFYNPPQLLFFKAQSDKVLPVKTEENPCIHVKPTHAYDPQLLIKLEASAYALLHEKTESRSP